MMQSVIRRVNTQVGEQTQTLMASLGEQPFRSGNFFTLKMFDGKWAWVQNISAEDFKEICKKKKLYSVYVLYLPESEKCFVIDDRIPWDWFRAYHSPTKEEHDDSIAMYKLTCSSGKIAQRFPHSISQDLFNEGNSTTYQLEFNFEYKGDDLNASNNKT